MKRALQILLAAVLVIGAGLIWWFSPTQIVKRQTHKLFSLVTLTPGTRRADCQFRSFKLDALLAPEVELAVPQLDEANGTFERADLEAGFSWLCEQAEQCTFKVQQVDGLRVTGSEAEVVVTVTAQVQVAHVRPIDGIYQAKLRWRLQEGHWQLVRVRWAEPAGPRQPGPKPEKTRRF